MESKRSMAKVYIDSFYAPVLPRPQADLIWPQADELDQRRQKPGLWRARAGCTSYVENLRDCAYIYIYRDKVSVHIYIYIWIDNVYVYIYIDMYADMYYIYIYVCMYLHCLCMLSSISRAVE